MSLKRNDTVKVTGSFFYEIATINLEMQKYKGQIAEQGARANHHSCHDPC